MSIKTTNLSCNDETRVCNKKNELSIKNERQRSVLFNCGFFRLKLCRLKRRKPVLAR